MIRSWLKRRRRRRVLERAPIPDTTWRQAHRTLPWLQAMPEGELSTLRHMTTWFLDEKRFYGAADLTVDDRMTLAVAVQACIPVLHIGFDALDQWTSVILYPGEFRARHSHENEYGLVTESDEEMTGEAWLGGPLVLSWTDVAAAIEYPNDGENVVFHEIAHKLDMLNGDANGHPPLHPGMDNGSWARDMQVAFDGLNAALDRGEETEIDPYAATDPAEFFAVTSEYFFEDPATLERTMPAVATQLRDFYRPATR